MHYIAYYVIKIGRGFGSCWQDDAVLCVIYDEENDTSERPSECATSFAFWLGIEAEEV